MKREILFPKLINEMNIRQGVEVGVAEGKHSINILRNSNIEYLHCIDPYFDNLPAAKEKDGTKRYMTAIENLTPWIDERDECRCEVIRAKGLDVVQRFDDNILGFVYLDGDRSKDVFPVEVRAWLPKIYIGGIMAGHDYKNKRGFMVKSMIDEFCSENEYELHTTTESCKSWWFRKTH